MKVPFMLGDAALSVISCLLGISILIFVMQCVKDTACESINWALYSSYCEVAAIRDSLLLFAIELCGKKSVTGVYARNVGAVSIRKFLSLFALEPYKK